MSGYFELCFSQSVKVVPGQGADILLTNTAWKNVSKFSSLTSRLTIK